MYGETLGSPHGTTPAAVMANKIKLRSFKSSEHINGKRDRPYRLSTFNGPIDFRFKSSEHIIGKVDGPYRVLDT